MVVLPRAAGSALDAFHLPAFNPACRAQGVQFMRHLVWQVLRVHHQGTTGIKPRVQRHLPVGGGWQLPLHLGLTAVSGALTTATRLALPASGVLAGRLAAAAGLPRLRLRR